MIKKTVQKTSPSIPMPKAKKITKKKKNSKTKKTEFP
ncbi:MAG: hypothetical protein ACI87N_002329 [Flavobacteriales bacterium]|jgi:hypothetical protein